MHPMIFCDFDGTITAVETFVAMFKAFAPDVSRQVLPQIYQRQITLRQGVRQILESIPSRCYPDILDFTRSQPTRPGFIEFLDFLDSHQVPLVVVSGGLRGMVEVVLGDLIQRVLAIHAIEVNTSQEYLQIDSPYEAGTEMVAKVDVIKQYSNQDGEIHAIAIGDSLTDLNMALYAPTVFARDRLAEYLNQHQKAYIPWNDFFDIRDHLMKMEEVPGSKF
ncbi:MAG: HAD-IB family phosphatase [Oscillatoriales cyanobacterium C42_A2020_001]|nr:HAD-IB family phosphatase [Leptolyngbyaceae cyanobacterium C42_A2020_001]